jgi:hypothetical protein
MFVVCGRAHISSDIGDAFDDAYDAGSYPTGRDFRANSEPKFEPQPEPGDLVAKPDAHHGAERDAFGLALEDAYCESQRVTECTTIF